VRVRVRVV